MDDDTSKRIREIREKLLQENYSQQQIAAAFNKFLQGKNIEEITYEDVSALIKANDTEKDTENNTKVPENFKNFTDELSEAEQNKRLKNQKMQEDIKKYQEEVRKQKLRDEMYLESIKNRFNQNKKTVKEKFEDHENIDESADSGFNENYCTINLKILNLGTTKKLMKSKNFLVKDLITEIKRDFNVQKILLMKGKKDLEMNTQFVGNPNITLEEIGFFPSVALALLE